MIIAAICDINERRIPNWLTVGGGASAFLAWTIQGDLACAGLLAGLAGLAAASPNLIRRRQVGAGDVKLAAVLGALLGLRDAMRARAAGGPAAMAVLGIGAFLALVTLLLLRVQRGDCGQPRTVALAPFLLAGFAVVGIAGD